MKKLIPLLLLLAFSCTDKTTNVFVGKERPPEHDNRGIKCVALPLPGSGMTSPPILPDERATPGKAASKLLTRWDSLNAQLPRAVVDFKVLVLLVDFPDKPFRESPAYFDQLFFADTGKTFKTFYKENSYGAVNSVTLNLPSSAPVYHAQNNYSYYTAGNYGFGAYPNNAQRLASEVTLAADAQVDFSQYDNDGDGTVDGIIIIHAGSGAELTGNPNDIWSHSWSFPALTVDGKTITDYCTAPEYWTDTRRMQIGVIVHEAGHRYFNQIDEYGTCGGWQGVGDHCCMAGGSYNGSTGLGDKPARFCAASKVRAGFNVPIPIDTAGYYVVHPNEIYRYGTGSEVIYVENRPVEAWQPGHGLLMIHGKSNFGQCYYWYPPLNADVTGWGIYQVVQADGLYELEKNLSAGDAEDYWPGPLGKTVLDSTTSPTSNFYSGTTGTPSGFNLIQITDTSFLFNKAAPPPPPPDSLVCPADTAAVIKGKGQTGKVVNYVTPTGATCTPPSGYKFGVGQTLVVCTNQAGSCTFTVTITRR